MTTQACPIGWFEIAASNQQEAEAFYGAAFNWTFTDSPMGSDFRMAGAGDGLPGAVVKAAPGMPTTYAMFGIMVPDVAASCVQVTELGGKVLVGPVALPDGLTFANLEDPDGNLIAIFTPPAN